MLQKNIGTISAMIYVAVAGIYEARRQYNQAEHGFLLGINQRAEPLTKLKRLYTEFVNRNQRCRFSEKYSDEVSVEEVRALSFLRGKIDEIESINEFGDCYSPDRVVSQENIRMSAYKQTPKLEGIYQSPHQSNIIVRESPHDIRGRRPFRPL